MSRDWIFWGLVLGVAILVAIGVAVHFVRKNVPNFWLNFGGGRQNMSRGTGSGLQQGTGSGTQPKAWGTQLELVENLTWNFFAVLLLLSVLYSVAYAISQSQIFGFLHPLGMLIAAIFASAAIGGFLGFLFGIPRNLQRPAPAAAPAEGQDGAAPPPATPSKPIAVAADGRRYAANTNLEEISDWITKIIVGLGLVQATTIIEKLWNLAGLFKAGLSGAVGSDVLFVLVVMASAIAGFLFCYLETRTRIPLLFVGADLDADVRDNPQVIGQVKDAPIVDYSQTQGPPSGAAKAAPLAIDQAFLNTTMETLKSGDQLAAWAAAQARAYNFSDAATAFIQAIAKEPENTDLKLKLADTQILQSQYPAAAATLKDALAQKPDDTELLKRELFVSLYLPREEGVPRALAAGRKLLATPAKQDPNVHLWLAAAYGQQYSMLKDAGADEAQKKKARDGALAAVKGVVDYSAGPNSSARVYLKRIFNPGGEKSPPDENDLEVFKEDREFWKAIYGEDPPAAGTPPKPPTPPTP